MGAWISITQEQAMPKQRNAKNAPPAPPSSLPTDEMKRQAFLRLRNENYIASLKLEGLSVAEEGTLITLASLKQKCAQ